MKQKKIKNYEYIKDGEVLIKPDLNCLEDNCKGMDAGPDPIDHWCNDGRDEPWDNYNE